MNNEHEKEKAQTVSLTIDGRKAKAFSGMWLIRVIEKEGIEIPSLCYHEFLKPYGACRLCIVEIENIRSGKRKVITSCNYPVRGGERVITSSDKIRRLRKIIIELLLSLSPHSRILNELAEKYGAKKNKFERSTAAYNCILCGSCVRACCEIAGANATSFSGRGSKRMTGPPFGEENEACIACGICNEVCPTGAASMQAFRLASLMKKPSTERWCRYHFMGINQGTICTMNYNCRRCEIEQNVRSWFGMHPLIALSYTKRGL